MEHYAERQGCYSEKEISVMIAESSSTTSSHSLVALSDEYERFTKVIKTYDSKKELKDKEERFRQRRERFQNKWKK